MASALNSVIGSNDTPSFVGRIERGVREMYAEDDLGGACLFAGDYINFGYWPKDINVRSGSLTIDQRMTSQQDMYRLVARKLDISPTHDVVEVGSGRGVGANLISTEFQPKSLTGVDFCKEQVFRARDVNRIAVEQGRVDYVVGDAENLPFANESKDRLYSVEAAQHFPSINGFVKEASRVLKPNGKICVASFFGCHDFAREVVSPLIQTVDAGIDKLPSTCSVINDLRESGFTDIKVQSIGKRVWSGFDKWVSQTKLSDSWTRNWKVAYESGDLDYYLIRGTKK